MVSRHGAGLDKMIKHWFDLVSPGDLVAHAPVNLALELVEQAFLVAEQ